MADTVHQGGLRAIGDSPTARRLRARRRAETRMKFYGLAAIAFAILALVALMSSVIISASGALKESYVTLTVRIDEAVVDPKGERDPKAIRLADFGGMTKALLRETFPHVTNRRDKRELYDLVSVGASFELADHIAANTDLIGETVSFQFLASDITDLYLQGAYGRLNKQAARGTLSISGENAVTITSSEDDFAQVLEVLRQGLLTDAQRNRRSAQLQENGARAFLDRAESAENAEERAAAEAEAAARSAERDRLLAIAEDLERRAEGGGGAEALSERTQSVLIRAGGGWIKLSEVDAAQAKGVVLSPLVETVDSTTDWSLYQASLPEASRKVSDKQLIWIETLKEMGAIERVFNKRFFTSSDSREPELAGIWGATVGSFWTMLVTFVLAFPIGVLSAIYLEEYATKNRLTHFIEININNLAAVPSIVFGLLGLAVFLQFFGVPRSAPLAGGMVLALMTLPTIIIASRVSIAAVPPSIRDAALGVGASRTQTTFHHVLPLAMPGILTGAILGMARALGETAPLILIGMVAFIVDIPSGVTDSATVLPVQVFRWSDFPERAFEARTAASICVLLVFLAIMNAAAVILRRKFERRW